MMQKKTSSERSNPRKSRPSPEITQLLPLYDIGGQSYFGYRMVLAAKLFDRVISRLLNEHSDLTLPQWRVMAQLGLVPEGTVRSLADGAAVDRAEISRAARALEKRGLLRRREDAADRRSPVFSLTPTGRRLYVKVRKPISNFIVHLIDDLNVRDLAAANRVIWAITRGCLGK
jgi:DNA-binding MarR family transcriptional regulator